MLLTRHFRISRLHTSRVVDKQGHSVAADTLQLLFLGEGRKAS